MAGFVERLITSGNISVGAHAKDWEEAVRLCGKMMTDSGNCRQEYVEAAIQNHKEIGPYYVIAPGIAMPHAKPDRGVIKTGYALLSLSEPVEFGDEDNDPVRLLIFAGAVNQEEHMNEVIPEVAELCDSDRHVQALLRATSRDEMIAALEDFKRDFEAGNI
jgi:mannitol/fructose-specific phosphotransferase system IIA component (Ntr-type)